MGGAGALCRLDLTDRRQDGNLLQVESSGHFEDMLSERSIRREWVTRAMEQPDETENHDDGTVHYLKQISEYEDRWLRIVVNVAKEPHRAVTAFFDRRLRRRTHENQNG